MAIQTSGSTCSQRTLVYRTLATEPSNSDRVLVTVLTILRGSQSHFDLGSLKPTPIATTHARRNFADYCELMGLPRRFTLPGLSRRAQFRAVGNGVPVPMGFAVACAIRDRRITENPRPCPCHCGRPLTGKQTSATVACRKRLQRERELAGPRARTVTCSSVDESRQTAALCNSG